MAAARFIMNAGRTTKQGQQVNVGKDYPEYQVVFGVADGEDPACDVVRRLMGEFPEADVSLVVTGPAGCPARPSTSARAA